MNGVTIQQLKEAGRCPEWLAEAQTKDAVVSIDDAGVITWHQGTWEDGTWERGVWLSGTWERGMWQGGTWEDGMWKGGTWKGGTWRNGTWERGTWERGVWLSGTWERGTWEDGSWKDGVWKDGVWNDGRMLAGTVEGGRLAYRGVCVSLRQATCIELPKGLWNLYYAPKTGLLEIGCKRKSLPEWDAFFAEDCAEWYVTPRNSDHFRSIRDTYDVAKFIINKIERATHEQSNNPTT